MRSGTSKEGSRWVLAPSCAQNQSFLTALCLPSSEVSILFLLSLQAQMPSSSYRTSGPGLALFPASRSVSCQADCLPADGKHSLLMHPTAAALLSLHSSSQVRLPSYHCRRWWPVGPCKCPAWLHPPPLARRSSFI